MYATGLVLELPFPPDDFGVAFGADVGWPGALAGLILELKLV